MMNGRFRPTYIVKTCVDEHFVESCINFKTKIYRVKTKIYRVGTGDPTNVDGPESNLRATSKIDR